ncbi:hypothetical protein, partial [Helicobacter ailurogastricus]|uniref:hypothetical protein n=2 Tax=Helicobacter ailurogastricus TaxID=1578720 RepID=UPI0024903036
MSLKSLLKRALPKSCKAFLKAAYKSMRSMPTYYLHPQKQSVFAKIAPLSNEDYIRANRLCGGGGGGKKGTNNPKSLNPGNPLINGNIQKAPRATQTKPPQTPWG